MELPQRKLQRLKGFDYSTNGAYFITMCAQDKIHLFGEIKDEHVILNDFGKMVEERLKKIDQEPIFLDKYCIMPDHIHVIIRITQKTVNSVSSLVKHFKMITTKLYIDGVKNGKYPAFDKKIWQKSFYDEIIKNEDHYNKVWQYIDTNPFK